MNIFSRYALAGAVVVAPVAIQAAYDQTKGPVVCYSNYITPQRVNISRLQSLPSNCQRVVGVNWPEPAQ